MSGEPAVHMGTKERESRAFAEEKAAYHLYERG